MASKSPLTNKGIRLVYVYDYMGRCSRKTTQYTTWNGSAWVFNPTLARDIKFVYDGWNLIAELNALASDAVLRKYTWGLDLSGQSGNPSVSGIHGAGGIGGLLANHDNTTNKDYLYFYSANGDVTQIADRSDGSIDARYEYYPYGGELLAFGPYCTTNPFRFSTKYFDHEARTYYYVYRFHLPKIGRWLNRDPIGEAGGIGLYVLARNDPTDYVDVLGLTACPCACQPGMKDLKDDLNQYVNAIIEATEGDSNLMFELLVTSLNIRKARLRNLTAIEDWFYDNHRASMTGVYDDVRRYALAPCLRLCGKCIGTDKIGHFFEEGRMYKDVADRMGCKCFATGLGEWLEGLVPDDPVVLAWIKAGYIDLNLSAGSIRGVVIHDLFGAFGDKAKLSANSQPVGHADLAANLAGFDFWNDLSKEGKKLRFDICKYVTSAWDENINPNGPEEAKPPRFP
jgi:RHS repeat-associated protein